MRITGALPRTCVVSSFLLTACGTDVGDAASVGVSGGTATDGTTQASAATSGPTSTTSAPTVGTDVAETGDSAGTSASASSASTTVGGSAGTSTGAASSTTTPLPDMGPALPECNDIDPGNNCSAVDILFVIDNSTSMEDAQAAVGQAFPGFVHAMIELLPCGTSLHVGVTSTEMGYANSGSTMNCVADSNGAPVEDFYVTPDTDPSNKNGAQGRLFEANGQTYYEILTDAPAAEIQGLEEWFAAAAAIGTGGSNIEMATAPAGWVADPANDATNAGFVRDEGAVLVVFFLQDEPDQTPSLIDGVSAGAAMLSKLAAAKTFCGGTECVIGGGMINTGCMDETPIGEFLGGMGAPPVTAAFPFDPPTADDFVTVFEETLAGVIAQKCEEIGPL